MEWTASMEAIRKFAESAQGELGYDDSDVPTAALAELGVSPSQFEGVVDSFIGMAEDYVENDEIAYATRDAASKIGGPAAVAVAQGFYYEDDIDSILSGGDDDDDDDSESGGAQAVVDQYPTPPAPPESEVRRGRPPNPHEPHPELGDLTAGVGTSVYDPRDVAEARNWVERAEEAYDDDRSWENYDDLVAAQRERHRLIKIYDPENIVDPSRREELITELGRRKRGVYREPEDAIQRTYDAIRRAVEEDAARVQADAQGDNSSRTQEETAAIVAFRPQFIRKPTLSQETFTSRYLAAYPDDEHSALRSRYLQAAQQIGWPDPSGGHYDSVGVDADRDKEVLRQYASHKFAHKHWPNADFAASPEAMAAASRATAEHIAQAAEEVAAGQRDRKHFWEVRDAAQHAGRRVIHEAASVPERLQSIAAQMNFPAATPSRSPSARSARYPGQYAPRPTASRPGPGYSRRGRGGHDFPRGKR